jgi:DNA-binding NarL/FixJ family response regulator
MKKPLLIFIIEDNMIYAKSIQHYLKTVLLDDSEIKHFSVGELCLQNMHLKPDFIITDYFLNTKFFDASDGGDIIKQIRAKDAKVPIILLSSTTDQEIIKKVSAEKNVSFIAKGPDAFGQILQIIRSQGWETTI